MCATSFVYCPSPTKGGTAKVNAIPQKTRIYLDDISVVFVCECQDRSKRTTDKYRTTAMPVIVNSEFMPI